MAQSIAGIQRAHGGEIIGKIGQRVGLPQAQDAVFEFSGLQRRRAAQIVATGTRMRIDITEWRVFPVQ